MTFDEIDKLIADHIRQGLSKTEITKRIEADSEMREAAFKLMISDTIKGKWDPAAHGFFDLAAAIDESILHYLSKQPWRDN
jgi:hypothetical protein